MKRTLRLLILSILSSLTLTVAGLLYVNNINVIDFQAAEYGFPYPWLVHVTATIAGRADTWSFETSNFIMDTVLFFVLSLGLWFLIFRNKERP